jgi:hypothetical protein
MTGDCVTQDNRTWLDAHSDHIAKWMFLASTIFTSADGTVALVRGDYLTGLLGLAAALASAAGAIVSSKAAKVEDDKHAA